MGELIDIKELQEFDELAKNIETIMNMDSSPCHEYYEARDRRILRQLKKDYDIEDNLNLALALSEKLINAEDGIPNLIKKLYIVYNEIFFEYMTFKLWDVKDEVEEFWEFDRSNAHSDRAELIKMELQDNKRIR